MIISTHHTGLVVRDLQTSLAFYSQVFDFTLLSQAIEKGDFIEKLIGIPGIKLEQVKLQAPDGSLLELLQYHSHPDKNPLEPAPINQLGCSHPAFTVEDIETVHRDLEKRGCNIVNPPQISPDGNIRIMYCHDPDGITLEIIEELGEFAPSPDDIDLIVYDFDGVMTDNTVLVHENGLESVVCNRGDGWGIDMIRKQGIEQVILSTEENPVVLARANKLKLECIHKSKDKAEGLRQLADSRAIHFNKVLYVGNDMNDFDAMQLCGYKVAPADSHPNILTLADHVTKAAGGRGVIRELADILAT